MPRTSKLLPTRSHFFMLCWLSTALITAALLPSAAAWGQNSQLGVYGDNRARQDDFVRYLGSRCSSLYSLLNPGPYNQQNRYSEAQALRMRDARREYNEYCQEEVSAAHEKASKLNQAQRKDRMDSARQEKDQAFAQQQQDDRKRQQCGESRLILAAKKQRTDLNAGELQELARFEENFRQRCSSASATSAPAAPAAR